MLNKLAASELVLNDDGSVYHLNLLPEDIAGKIITADLFPTTLQPRCITGKLVTPMHKQPHINRGGIMGPMLEHMTVTRQGMT